MFHNRSRTVIAIALACVAAASTAAPPSDPLRSKFEALYADYAKGVSEMDQPRWQKYLTSDFMMIDTDNRAHSASEMKKYQDINTRTTKRVISYTNEIEALAQPSPGKVTAIILQKYDRVQAPLNRPTETHEILTSVVQRELWRKTKNGWRQYRVEELLKGPVYFDGKIMSD